MHPRTYNLITRLSYDILQICFISTIGATLICFPANDKSTVCTSIFDTKFTNLDPPRPNQHQHHHLELQIFLLSHLLENHFPSLIFLQIFPVLLCL